MLKEIIDSLELPPLCEREKMVDTLLCQEYGYLPPEPESVEFQVEDNAKKYKNLFGGKATKQDLTITTRFDNKTFSFPCEVFIPNGEGKKPFFVYIAFATALSSVYTPYEEIIDNGFGVIKFCYNDVTSDDADFTNGLAGILYQDGKRGPTDAGKISMWAWAAHRAMDYLETLDCVDLDRVTVCGHSRLGKTALLAGATDTRFACAYSNDSGCSGAAISRKKVGEQISDICKHFPYWFCENYYQYINNENAMPFDQHWLIASIAPRRVYVASASEDTWADPKNEFLSCVAAASAFENGFVCEDRIADVGDTYHDGDVGYHLRDGRHYMSRYDWQKAIDFIKSKQR